MNETRDDFWNPQEGEYIKGVYVDKLENVGKFENTLYKIQDKNIIYCIWGKVQLDSIMEVAKIGDLIQIQYVGCETINGRFQMKRYELEILDNEE